VLSSNQHSELEKIAGFIDELRLDWGTHPDQSQVARKVLKELVDRIASSQPVNVARVFKEMSGFYPSNDM
tara:strand:+ start:293 stop:502 length:210 start_codon:yes stop_codon:yes gene_type:complete